MLTLGMDSVQNSSFQRRAGFGVLEALVGLSLAGIALAAIGTIFLQSSRSQRNLASAGDLNSDMLMVQKILTDPTLCIQGVSPNTARLVIDPNNPSASLVKIYEPGNNSVLLEAGPNPNPMTKIITESMAITRFVPATLAGTGAGATTAYFATLEIRSKLAETSGGVRERTNTFRFPVVLDGSNTVVSCSFAKQNNTNTQDLCTHISGGSYDTASKQCSIAPPPPPPPSVPQSCVALGGVMLGDKCTFPGTVSTPQDACKMVGGSYIKGVCEMGGGTTTTTTGGTTTTTGGTTGGTTTTTGGSSTGGGTGGSTTSTSSSVTVTAACERLGGAMSGSHCSLLDPPTPSAPAHDTFAVSQDLDTDSRETDLKPEEVITCPPGYTASVASINYSSGMSGMFKYEPQKITTYGLSGIAFYHTINHASRDIAARATVVCSK